MADKAEKSPSEIIVFAGVTKVFSGNKVLDDVSFGIAQGEVHAIVGENGAGKSTLMNLLSGQYQPDGGDILLFGKKTRIANPQRARSLGLTVVHQELNLCPNMNVADNLFLGQEPRKWGLFHDKGAVQSRTQEVLREMRLDLSPQTLIGELSIAQQQLLEIARAVFMDANIIIMDEPTSALTIDETRLLFGIINRLKRLGLTIIFISHRLEEVLTISDRVSVLRDGKHIRTNITSEVTPSELVNQIIGRSLADFYQEPQTAVQDQEPVLTVENLSLAKAFEGVSFTLRRGEILGLAGLEGSGRRELLRCLFGLLRLDDGQVRLDGREVRLSSPRRAVQAGLGLVPSDRRGEGCLLLMSLRDNVAIAKMDQVSDWLLINFARRNRLACRAIEDLAIQCHSAAQLAVTLSGGNQQKMILARWLATNPRVLLLDEPTRGVDVGAKSEIYKIMRRLSGQGIAMIVLSSEIPELLAECSRILVMFKGRISAEYDRNEVDADTLIKAVSGEVASG